MWFKPSKFQATVDDKRTRREKILSSAHRYIEAEHNAYTNATASEIVKRIENGEWSASQVVESYIARAAYAHATTNCGTEILFEGARREAKELDDEFASTKKLRGPLHGVPFSVKDLFNVSSIDSTVGFTEWAYNPATKDASLVAQLRAAGAIPIIKTNVPQTMMAFECSNPLWGRTTNPWNKDYTCGGSSGGEGAILAMDGSAFGIGSDIGGSLRIPASYCGIYSLKPSHERINSEGARTPTPGFEGVKAVVGPMGRSVEDLDIICRTVFGVQGLTPHPPVPYRDVTLPSKLKFGYYTSDYFIKASPACKRAVLETVEALRREGHECVEFEVPDSLKPIGTFVGLTSADGYKTLLSSLGPDPQEKSLFLLTLGPKLNFILRNIAIWAVETFLKDPLFAVTMRHSRVKPVEEYMAYTEERDAYARLWYKEVWGKYQFDGIISPVQAMPVIGHGDCATLSPLAGATILYNIVDSPAGCVPVTRVDPAKDQITDEWKNGPGLGSKFIENALYHAKRPTYDPERMKGIPVGVQIVGKKWEDEKVLAMMDVVDKALGPRGFGPGSWHEGKTEG